MEVEGAQQLHICPSTMKLPRQWNERSLNVSYRIGKSRVHGCQESGFRNKRVESNTLLHSAYSYPPLHCSRHCTWSLSYSQRPPSPFLWAHPLPWRGSDLPVDAGAHRLKCTVSRMVPIHVHRHCLQKAAKTNIPTLCQSATLPNNLMLICPWTILLSFYFLFKIRILKRLIIVTSFTDTLLNQ